MKIDENLWKPMKNNENQWKSIPDPDPAPDPDPDPDSGPDSKKHQAESFLFNENVWKHNEKSMVFYEIARSIV